MDSNSFQNISKAVKEQHFKDKKLDALKTSLSCSYGYLSSEQVAQLLSEFKFDEDKTNAVRVCAPRMYSITCQQAVSILGVFAFDGKKIEALEAFVPHVTDNNLAALERAFKFERERKKVRDILQNRPQPGPQPGFSPQSGVQYPGVAPSAGAIPGMVSQPQPGGYPSPASYYPGSGPYPYGTTPTPYPNGAVPHPGGALGEMMTSTAGAVMQGISDMFGPPAPQRPPPGGYPQPRYPYPPPQ